MIKKSILIVVFMFSVCSTSCNNTPSPSPTGSYNIVWKNYDGNILQSENYNYGDMPSYKGATPLKGPDGQYTYTFSGWSPSITAVTGPAEYHAQFSASLRGFDIKWYSCGILLETDLVAYGEIPTYKGTMPTKASTDQYSYAFSGWSPIVKPVTGPAVYHAQFTETLRKYDVKWYNGITVLETDSVEYGKTPTYTGVPPTKRSDGQYTYTFSGWSPSITAVTGPAEYHAQFSSSATKYTVTVDSSTGGYASVRDGEKHSWGTTVYIFADPNKYCIFDGWFKDGNLVTTERNYHFTMPQSDVHYSAKFHEVESIEVIAKTNTDEPIEGAGIYKPGTNVHLHSAGPTHVRVIEFCCWVLPDGTEYYDDYMRNNYDFTVGESFGLVSPIRFIAVWSYLPNNY